MFRILNHDQIPFADQAGRLFNLTGNQLSNDGKQRIIPFLGAGVSISGRPPNPHPAIDNLASLNLDSLLQQLGLDGRAKVFIELAILIAYLMQFREQQDAAKQHEENFDLRTTLQADAYPPSAGELAQFFSQLANYTTFRDIVRRLRGEFPGYSFNATEEYQVEALKLLANVTGIANPPDLLTSIASYFESVGGRESLWNNLSSVISLKNTPTATHKLLAAAARDHFKNKYALDYLIITTNYDCLMEKALDDIDVPYAVLLTRKSDQKVVVRFSEKIPDAERLDDLNKGETSGNFANGFVLQKSGDLRNVVVIYKIHGCLSPKLKREEADGVIISDNDYVDYIKQMGKGSNVIPSHVNTMMNSKPFLFLGYSLNDWNIRSIFETMREKRSRHGGVQDVSVMYKVGEFEEVFFQRNDILIFKTDLNSFVNGVVRQLPKDMREGVPL